MPPSLRYQFVEVVREARPDPNAQSLTSPQPGEHLGNFDEQVWGELRERGHFRIEGSVHATKGPFVVLVLLTTADNQPLNSAVGGNGQQYAQLSGRRHRQRSTEDVQ